MTEIPADRTQLPEHIEATVRALAELHADHHRRAPHIQRVVDRAVRLVGRPRFVAIVTVFVTLWIALNLILGRYGAAIDAPPFPTLQGIAELAALYITVLILITQRHETELSDHRQQLTLELMMLSEQKSAKIVELIEEMRRDNPMMKDRIDAQANALSVPADPQTVLGAIKDKQEEILASLDAEIAGLSAAPAPEAELPAAEPPEAESPEAESPGSSA